jgi:hypothetical protein
MIFKKSELDTERLYDRARDEAIEIYSKDSTRKGRTLEQIIETVEYGHTAEWFLIEKMGWLDNPARYNDVIDPDGKWVEIKVTKIPQYAPSVIQRLNEHRRNLDKWGKPAANHAMIFTNDPDQDDTYKFYGYYEWNGFNFIEKKCVHLT